MKLHHALTGGLALWLTTNLALGASDADLLARIGGEPITAFDLRMYARSNPFFFSELQVPGGPRRVLNNLINERLLLLEGQRLGIPRPAGDPEDDIAYVYRVRDRLVEPCPTPDEATVKAFYEAHLDRFSTPLLLRLRRLVLPAGPESEARLAELKGQIAAGQADFSALAEEISVDPVGKGRGGDLGFQPVDKSDPLTVELGKLAKGGVLGPVTQGKFVALYQVTDRREPIPDPYETARARVAEEQVRQCKEDGFARVLGELKARWPVEVYVEDIGVYPEAPPEAARPAPR